MKTTIAKNKSFQSVSLTLTFETQRELDVYASFFNCAPISETMEALGVPYVDYRLLGNAGGKDNNTLEILNALMGTDYMQLKYSRKP